MVAWHHWLNGYRFEQALGDSEGQGSLAKESSIPGWEDSLEEEMATHYSILAWKILGTEESEKAGL